MYGRVFKEARGDGLSPEAYGHRYSTLPSTHSSYLSSVLPLLLPQAAEYTAKGTNFELCVRTLLGYFILQRA